MIQTVLLGDPAFFQIRHGLNPHTRDRWGRLKRVDPERAQVQWKALKAALEHHEVKVHVVAPSQDLSGLVFPANAGFRFGQRFYLSNLNPGRAGEREVYRKHISALGLEVVDLPTPLPFEGEADFIPVGHPSGDPSKKTFLFTHGKIVPSRPVRRFGWPPRGRTYGFRSDIRVAENLRKIVYPLDVTTLELRDPAHYHGDTALCPFGPNRELLLVYLGAFTPSAQTALRIRFGSRLVLLSEADGRRFAANSFQITAEYYGESVRLLLMPDGLTQELYEEIRARGVVPFPVNVSEFLEKGGGAVKCMLLDLGGL